MSSSYGTRNIVGTDEKNSRLPWGTGGTGRKYESITSGNDGMAATVLFSGGVFMDKTKNKNVVDTNHFHVSLVHAHSSVLKANAQ